MKQKGKHLKPMTKACILRRVGKGIFVCTVPLIMLMSGPMRAAAYAESPVSEPPAVSAPADPAPEETTQETPEETTQVEGTMDEVSGTVAPAAGESSFTGMSAEREEGLGVYYVDDALTASQTMTGVLADEQGRVSFSPEHFSIYTVAVTPATDTRTIKYFVGST